MESVVRILGTPSDAWFMCDSSDIINVFTRVDMSAGRGCFDCTGADFVTGIAFRFCRWTGIVKLA